MRNKRIIRTDFSEPAPEIRPEPGINQANRSLILSVRNQLEAVGVLDRDPQIGGLRNEDEIDDLLADAASKSQSGEDFNADFYDPEATAALSESGRSTTRNDLIDNDGTEDGWEKGPQSNNRIDHSMFDL